MRSRTVLRFFVAAPDGRRSAEWRILTAAEKRRPKDDVYLAPQSLMKDFKISLHRDGWAQYGLSDKVREQLRPGDKKALLRWQMPEVRVVPNWQVLYTLQFPESELDYCEGEPAAQAVRVPASRPERSLHILILTSDGKYPLPSDARIVGQLDRENGGLVAVIALETDFDPRTFEGFDDTNGAPFEWSIPRIATIHEPFGWVVHAGKDGVRRSTEYNNRLRQQKYARNLREFRGTTLPWDKKPAEIHHEDAACAILVCSRRRRPKLFVDLRARCNHEHLAGDAMKLVAAYERHEIDGGWGRLRNGDHYTLISMPEVLKAKGIENWFPAPGD